MERHFYRLKEVTREDLSLLHELFINGRPEYVQQVHRRWVSMFTTAFELKRRYQAHGPINEVFEREFDKALNNIEEDIQTGIENGAAHLLAAARNRDLSFLASDAEFATFAHYLSVQYMRTANMRSRCLAAMARTAIPGFDGRRAWGIFSHMFATDLGAALYRDRSRTRVTLLETVPGCELITADQPIINLRAVNTTKELEADDLDLYYPVSPRLAVLMESGRSRGSIATESIGMPEAERYNRLLFHEAQKQRYATTELQLRTIADAGPLV